MTAYAHNSKTLRRPGNIYQIGEKPGCRPSPGPEMILTVAEVISWYHAHELRALSLAGVIEHKRQRAMFVETYGHLSVTDCRPADLLSFIAAQKRAKSGWTQRRIKATICRPFNVAAELGLIAKNPFRGLKFPEGVPGRDWTKEEFQALLRNSPALLRRLYVFIRFSGARPGEARSLRWTEILEEVQAIVQQQHKGAWRNHGPRRIHFNDVILKLLAWLRRDRDANPTFMRGRTRHRANQDFVFLNSYGGRWKQRPLATFFQESRDRAELPKDVKLHGLRHTFATNAIINGVGVATLAELLGHNSLATTQRYVHLVNKKAHLNAAMNQAIGRAAPAADAAGASAPS